MITNNEFNESDEIMVMVGIVEAHQALTAMGVHIPFGTMSSVSSAIYLKLKLASRRLADPNDKFSMAGMRADAEYLLGLLKPLVTEEIISGAEAGYDAIVSEAQVRQ